MARKSLQARFMDASIALKKGGRGTRERMHSTFGQLEKVAKAGGWAHVCPQTITVRQAASYVQARLAQGISGHSIQTEASAIRRALMGIGRRIDAEKMFTSEALGVPAVSRKGTGKAIDMGVFEEKRQMADPHTRALMDAQIVLGFRLNELIECLDSLKTWERMLRIAAPQVSITLGTKGGRPRNVYVFPEMREKTYKTIAALLEVTNGGKDYPMPSRSGASARRMYSDRLAALELQGAESSHSFRRRFAVDQYQRYCVSGLTKPDALSRVSLDLGHGDGRGRWVWNNYIAASLL